MPPARTGHRRSVKVRVILGVVVLAVSGAVIAASAGADDGPGYRLATVTTDSTQQVLDEVGVIEPVSQVGVSFPASGTVATVEVAAGDTVAIGDVLATLDPTSLERALHDAQATLAQAEVRLERALNGEDVGSVGGAPTGTAIAMTVDGEDLDVQLASATAEDPELRAAQEAVLAAQRQVDEDLAAANEALADAEALCGWADDETGGGPDSGTDTADDDAAIEACRDALDAVLMAQQTVAASQQALADAATDLDELLAERAAALETPTTSPQVPSGGGNQPSDGSAETGPSTGAATSSPSSADLIAYQAAVDAAEADVAVATQAITQATIVSPIDGTVASVGLEPGDEVSAASADQAIVVAGDGGYEVTTTVSVSELPDLEVGQAVLVSPDGRDVQLEGEIVAVGVAATDGTTGYPVTIALVEPADTALRNGAIASLAITTAGANETLVVPTSAVTVDGSTATVTAYDGADVTEVTVEVGAIGSIWTEIRSGLEAGQQVVLADLSEPLPGTATESNDTDGTVTFPGGPPGGFVGGPPGG
jgi:HlyD family secretion protein